MEKLTLQKFEEAAEKVKEVTLQTNLVYSEYFSAQSGNKVYLKPWKNSSTQVLTRYVVHIIKSAPCQKRNVKKV